jgi:hypothetical protein
MAAMRRRAWREVEVVLHGQLGVPLRQAPLLTGMLANAATGRFDVVVAHVLDRPTWAIDSRQGEAS